MNKRMRNSLERMLAFGRLGLLDAVTTNIDCGDLYSRNEGTTAPDEVDEYYVSPFRWEKGYGTCYSAIGCLLTPQQLDWIQAQGRMAASVRDLPDILPGFSAEAQFGMTLEQAWILEVEHDWQVVHEERCADFLEQVQGVLDGRITALRGVSFASGAELGANVLYLPGAVANYPPEVRYDRQPKGER